MPGVSSLPRIAILRVSLFAFPALTLSSAEGEATWTDVALGAYTHLGKVRVTVRPLAFVASGIDSDAIWNCNAATGDFDDSPLFPPDGAAHTRR